MDDKLREELMRPELSLLDKYRVLETALVNIRKQHGIGVSADEDAVLDEMDWIWQHTTDAERKAIRRMAQDAGNRS